MKWVAMALLLLGTAGFFLLREPQYRWESAGVAVVGFVLLLTRRIEAE